MLWISEQLSFPFLIIEWSGGRLIELLALYSTGIAENTVLITISLQT